MKSKIVISWDKSGITFITFCVTMIFLLVTTVIDVKMILPNVILSISLLIGFAFIFDSKRGLFCLRNLFFVLFFLAGIYFRYIVVIANKGEFCSFVNGTVEIELWKNFKTSIVIMGVSALFAVILNTKRINHRYHENEPQVKDIYEKRQLTKQFNIISNLIFVILLIVVYGYSFRYLSTAVTFTASGSFDYVITVLRYLVCLIAYIDLIEYFDNKRIIILLPYLIFITLDVSLSLVQAWKGKIMYEVIAFLVIYYLKHGKIQLKWITLGLAVFMIIYPGISMYRDILTNSASTYVLNINGILDYYKTHDMFTILSHRLSYYDEIYYCLDLSNSTISGFINEAGTILTQLFTGIIPRAIWPNKPSVSQGLLVTYYFMHYPMYKGASTITFLGDAYVSYGYFGIVIITILYGILLNRVDIVFKETSSFEIAKSVVFCIILLTFMEGSLAGKFLTTILVYVLFKLFQLVFVRYQNPN